MTGAEWVPAIDGVFRALVRASVEGAVIVAAVWAGVRALPRLSARARAALWWIACVRFAVSLAGVAPIGVPLALPAPLASVMPRASDGGAGLSAEPTGATGATPRLDVGRPAVAAGIAADGALRASRPPAARVERIPQPPGPASWPWTVWVAAAWLGFLSVALLRVGLALRRSARARAEATPVDPGTLPAIARVASRFGLRRLPDVRLSESVRSPQLVWAGHATVLLPAATLRTWSASDVELALAHEFAHLRRRDLAWGAGVALVARAFAFHPLARLAAREYALAREAACDADVLARTDASPFDYGKLLLALGVTRRPALSLSSAAWSGRSLKRRLVMLEQHSASRRGRAAWIVIPAALIAGLVGLTAAAPGPEPAPQTSQVTVTPAQAAPAAPATTGPVLAAGIQAPPPPPPPPPMPAIAPVAPVPPLPPPRPPGAHLEPMGEVADAWVYLSEQHAFQHGSRHDRRLAEGLRKSGETLFWFARGGQEYVIRDKATLDRVEQLLAPERELVNGSRDTAEAQARLAHRQAEIAAKQAEVASRAAELGAKQAALGAEEAKLRAEALAGGRHGSIDEARARDLDAHARDVERQRQAIENELRSHEERLQAIEPEQARLAREMETRARQLEARMAQASRDLDNLLTKAITSGVAQPVR